MSFLWYLGSGLASTGLDMVLFALLLDLLGGRGAFVSSYFICIVVRYLFDSRVTFSGGGAASRIFLRYVAVNLCMMCFGFLIFSLLSSHFHEFLSKILSVPPVTLSGYFLMRRYVFPSFSSADRGG